MINDTILEDGANNIDSEKVVLYHNVHKYAVAPNNTKYFNAGVWVLGAKSNFRQYCCHWPDCMLHCWHYCMCNATVWL